MLSGSDTVCTGCGRIQMKMRDERGPFAPGDPVSTVERPTLSSNSALSGSGAVLLRESVQVGLLSVQIGALSV